MKLFFFVIFFSLVFIAPDDLLIANRSRLIMDNPCLPYHKKTRPVLDEFLISERFVDDRKRLGVEGIRPDSVVYLSEHQACKSFDTLDLINDDFSITLYMTDGYYFRVSYFNLPSAIKDGETYNIDNRSHSVIIYDSKFQILGGVLF